ncbi:hypothetical protein X777_11238 [Ooceraea biroi]|uniref:Uncharacterized protein n=1 Tax=Ooceraea biroi TaxID=2015173 RepID=A0A026W262_OOCBI|nr:hypothetical protein X777_11238 [Ooceraea biroi]
MVPRSSRDCHVVSTTLCGEYFAEGLCVGKIKYPIPRASSRDDDFDGGDCD